MLQLKREEQNIGGRVPRVVGWGVVGWIGIAHVIPLIDTPSSKYINR